MKFQNDLQFYTNLTDSRATVSLSIVLPVILPDMLATTTKTTHSSQLARGPYGR